MDCGSVGLALSMKERTHARGSERENGAWGADSGLPAVNTLSTSKAENNSISHESAALAVESGCGVDVDLEEVGCGTAAGGDASTTADVSKLHSTRPSVAARAAAAWEATDAVALPIRLGTFSCPEMFRCDTCRNTTSASISA